MTFRPDPRPRSNGRAYKPQAAIEHGRFRTMTATLPSTHPTGPLVATIARQLLTTDRGGLTLPPPYRLIAAIPVARQTAAPAISQPTPSPRRWLARSPLPGLISGRR